VNVEQKSDQFIRGFNYLGSSLNLAFIEFQTGKSICHAIDVLIALSIIGLTAISTSSL
jgi:hypothetical protein